MKNILVVGAGPAGLEAARALGQRGHKVTLADARAEAGGRVARECKLPGLSAWGRVRDWRLGQINKMRNVEFFLESTMTAETIAEFGADHVVVATGASWRRDGVARHHSRPIAIVESANILTPDDILNGKRPVDRNVVLYNDDHYYMGGVLAELLRKEGFNVTLVTPSYLVSSYTKASLEQPRIQTRMLELGVVIEANMAVQSVAGDHVTVACVFTGREKHVEAHSTVMVTAKDVDDSLYHALKSGTASRIGDCYSPGTIAAAVYSGRKLAEGFDEPEVDFLDLPYRREVTELRN